MNDSQKPQLNLRSVNRALLSQAFALDGKLGIVQQGANIGLQGLPLIDSCLAAQDFYERFFGNENGDGK